MFSLSWSNSVCEHIHSLQEYNSSDWVYMQAIFFCLQLHAWSAVIYNVYSKSVQSEMKNNLD